MTELLVEDKPITLAQLEKSDALIVFSRRNALKYKYDLEQVGFKVSIIYGMLSPEVRREQARKFDKGLTDVIVSTDAISMGMNLPIKRIVFSTLTKHINSQEYPITASEIKQIAGRAGRFQRFPVGGVTCLQKVDDGIAEIQDALTSVLDQQTQSMVGPDLDIFTKVNNALSSNNLPILRLSEFLRLFNTMTFTKPFYCVELKEMIELAETVEDIDSNNVLSSAEIFGFACAPVNLGLLEHVQYYVWMLKKYVTAEIIKNEHINFASNEIDYLETTIKCVELYQWLARHFNGKNFEFDERDLLENKLAAVDKLNILLSDKITPTCSSCGAKLPDTAKFAICEECFQQRRFTRRPPMNRRGPPGKGGDRPSHLASAVGSTKENFRQGKPSKKRKFAGKPKK
jgi:ATP-dependent RNA helicase SUPV3L1/SUV3